MQEYGKYIGRCVEWPRDEVNDLCEMVEAARYISYDTFTRHVPVAPLKTLFPHYAWGPGQPGELRLGKDWSVQYCRSKYRGEAVYFLVHSAIEYVFAKG